MRFISVCSGIEAATVAWIGWQAVAVSEIEPFPCAVLAHHYPNVPNWGDMTNFKDWPDADIDLLVGGTPCQSFSVAGLRKGLADPRGSLLLTYLAIALRYRPRWVVWENVPGVLSADDGRAFGSLLGGLAELGYGFAYRVLDAQHFGLAQRRQRVFVVGHLGDWRRAAAVLFERESLSGHPAPRREAGEGTTYSTAPSLTASGRGTERTGESRGQDCVIPSGHCIHGVHWASECRECGIWRYYPQADPTLPSRSTAGGGLGTDFDCDGGLIPSVANPLTARMHKGVNTTCDEGQTMIAHSLRADGFDASEDGTGRGTPLVPVGYHETGQGWWTEGLAGLRAEPGGMPENIVAFSAKDYGADACDLAPTLLAGGHDRSHANGGVMPAIAFHNRQDPDISGDVTHPIGAQDNSMAVAYGLRSDAGREGTAKTPSADAEGRVRLRDPGFNVYEEQAPTLDASAPHTVAFQASQSGMRIGDQHPTLDSHNGSRRHHGVMAGMQVRRLTPRECERLQGFPDDYTLIHYRGKPAADGPRYKALGNSMAVPVMAWIGRRIQMVDEIADEARIA